MADPALYRIGVDTGGTFTDVVLTGPDGEMAIGKASTTRDRISRGMIEAIGVAAAQLDLSVEPLLRKTGLLIYGSTTATNAILEGKTARTALIVTEGFPDILVRREGGKSNPWDFTEPFPEPYVPRSLTFEAPERISAEGEVLKPLDEAAVAHLIERLAEERVEAVAVSLLWSIANPAHERRIGELLQARLPDTPYTLSSELNPVIREYRRTSAAAIDASLKPLMQAHLLEMRRDLRAAGFAGELLVATSLGGVAHVADVVARPIEMVRSGPALAPVLGAQLAQAEAGAANAIVCDTGGTSFDVSLVRDGRPVHSRETWLGPRYTGHLTGLSSIDARSVGSGGGSIAHVDAGGLLRVGPESAGAFPGPACYGRGGDRPTVTDAAVVLGYLDPDYFLGGRMTLDVAAAKNVIGGIARRLGKSLEETAFGIMTIASEHMVAAIKEITINEGVDPRESFIVAGGGAGGLNMTLIAGELGCGRVLFPRSAGALCAMGAQFCDVIREWGVCRVVRSDAGDVAAIREALASLEASMASFRLDLAERGVTAFETTFIAEARYLGQVWEIEIPIEEDFDRDDAFARLIGRFHRSHQTIFAVHDPDGVVEFTHWRGRLTAKLPKTLIEPRQAAVAPASAEKWVKAYFGGAGLVDIPVFHADLLQPGTEIEGPALLVEPISTIVLYPGSRSRMTALGNHMVEILEQQI